MEHAVDNNIMTNETRTFCMDARADYGGDMLPTDIHRQPFAPAPEALRRVDQDDPAEPNDPPLERANQARNETAEFNHKATHVLAWMGWTTCAIAGELGITQRRVQALVKQPCEALEVERREAKEREAREQAARSTNAPFFTEVKDRKPIWLDEALPTREKIKRCLRDGKASQAEVARRLGISRQAVSKHVQALAALQ
ncbi:winged helix-turn-helix transcriptional regulator [Sinorhizobium fredii]|uniref:winged helix-turn-helix transcriptional regulator n=1 Tax=Rhizobium fredii TaxID=380 RepID=UPI003518B2C9